MIEVLESADDHRFVIEVDGEPAGRLDYRTRGDVVVALHTEIDPAYEGRGLGGTLVSGALDQLRSSGRRVQAICPFVSRYLDKHPEYADLVANGTPGHGSSDEGAS